MAGSKNNRFLFDDFELDSRERTLKRSGVVVTFENRQGKRSTLRGKDFQVLEHLLKRAGHLVSPEELIHAVWGPVAFRKENLATHITHVRNALRAGESARKYLENIPSAGYRFLKPEGPGRFWRVEEIPTDSTERIEVLAQGEATKAPDMAQTTGATKTSQMNSQTNQNQAIDHSALDTVHVHVDGGDSTYLIDDLVADFNRRGWHSNRNKVLGFIAGPQRALKPHAYKPHTPGGLEAEELTYFSTHLFGNFAVTKRELHELLMRLQKAGVPEIVVEAERVVGKLGYPSREIQWSDISAPDYSSLCSGDVGYATAEETEPIEIHYACDVPKVGKWANKPPFDPEAPDGLKPLVELSTTVGIRVGGWFVFDKPSANKWAYRSNMFETGVDRDRIVEGWKQLRAKLIDTVGDCTVRALIEHSIGIWKTPLKRYDGTRTVQELSDWEQKYPNLREFWVVTPNFLGDKEQPIQDAMVHNLLHRDVTYIYFLRSIADYNRLVSLAEELENKIGEDVWDRIRAVILVRDASDERALRQIFESKQNQGFFIANPLRNDEIADDADGYALVKTKGEPGRISGGKIMSEAQLNDVITMLQPLVRDSTSTGVCRPLQGYCMAVRPQENAELSGLSVLCIGLHKLPGLLTDVEDEDIARFLRDYDLLVASVTSQFGGRVARSIEPGYLLIFRKQDDALACAEQLCKAGNSKFKQTIAIDCGDVWRVMRAHGTDYCGKTVTRCRELLKRAKVGQVTMTVFFKEQLPRALADRVEPRSDDHFMFENNKIRIFALKIDSRPARNKKSRSEAVNQPKGSRH